MKRLSHRVKSLSLYLLVLLISGCGGGGGASNLAVASNSCDAFPQAPVRITVRLTKAVDRASVVPGTSLILAGALDKNATGKLSFPQDDTLTFTSDKPWAQISSGGTDAGITLTLKSTIKAQDGSPMEQCKTGKPGTEQPGDCVLSCVIPG